MSQFHKATLTLTLWYIAILATVCLGFSVVIYGFSANEFDRPLSTDSQQRFPDLDSIDVFQELREERAAESKHNVLLNLVGLNAVTLVLGASVSYLFAKRTLRPIEEALDAQTRFTSDASHELRTPLAVMRTENEIALRDKKPTVTMLKGALVSNLEEIERLQQLTDRLLALSDKQELPLEPFLIDAPIKEAISRHKALAAQHTIKIRFISTDKSLRANGNSDSVCDIIAILLENAIKYSPEKTVITISALARGNYIDIAVSDQGVGIAPDDMEHIFDRFYRADQSRTKQHTEGYGLGLALAKRLMMQNRASIIVTPGASRGTVFTLRLNRHKLPSR